MPHGHGAQGASGHQHDQDRPIRWARWYDFSMTFWGRTNRRLWVAVGEALRRQPGDRLLDAGCGTGELAITLAPRVALGGGGRLLVADFHSLIEGILRDAGEGSVSSRHLP